LSAVTPDAAVLLIARTLIGVAIAYIAEYAPKNRRGSLAMLQQWMITVGILISYIVALIIFSAFPGSAATVGWRLVLGLGAVPALVGLAFRTHGRICSGPSRYAGMIFFALVAAAGLTFTHGMFRLVVIMIGLAGVMMVFAGLCALAIVFVWKFLPETKNLPVEEIIGLFEKQQTSLPEAA
jgi:MFS family permease